MECGAYLPETGVEILEDENDGSIMEICGNTAKIEPLTENEGKYRITGIKSISNARKNLVL